EVRPHRPRRADLRRRARRGLLRRRRPPPRRRGDAARREDDHCPREATRRSVRGKYEGSTSSGLTDRPSSAMLSHMWNFFNDDEGVEQSVTVTDGSVVIQSGRDVVINEGHTTVTRNTFDEPMQGVEMHFGPGGVWINGKRVG